MARVGRKANVVIRDGSRRVATVAEFELLAGRKLTARERGAIDEAIGLARGAAERSTQRGGRRISDGAKAEAYDVLRSVFPAGADFGPEFVPFHWALRFVSLEVSKRDPEVQPVRVWSNRGRARAKVCLKCERLMPGAYYVTSSQLCADCRNEEPMRRCRSCGRDRPLWAFRRYARRPRCRECHERHVTEKGGRL